jgi:hypothetical protein
MIIYIINTRIIKGPGGSKWMFLTFGGVMVNGSFTAAEGVSPDIEVVGILIDPISDKPVIIPNTCV